MVFIADSIGTEYEKWKAGNTIFISSPTGSGKTTFVLKTLLPYWAREGKRILYLVNRKILKKQLEKEIRDLPFEVRQAIRIELYQTIESKFSNLDFREHISYEFYLGLKSAVQQIIAPAYRDSCLQKISQRGIKGLCIDGQLGVKEYMEYDCVICDEAHYFLMDSNYNTNTALSYNFVRDNFSSKLKIYMSATIEQIKEFIEKDNEKMKNFKTQWFGFSTILVNKKYHLENHKVHTYAAERNYDYIDIHIIQEREDMASMVTQGNEK